MAINFYTSKRSFRRFAFTFLPILGFEIATALPFAICSVMIGYMGDPLAVGAYGLYNFFVNIIISPFMHSIIEVGGVFFSKKFGEKDYPGLIVYFYKTIFAALPVLGIYVLLALQSQNLLLGLGIAPSLAIRAANIIRASIYMYPLDYGILMIKVYLMSQNIQKEFMVLNFLTAPVVFFVGKIFILDLGYGELGIIPTFIIMNLFGLAYTLGVVWWYMDRRALGLASIHDIFEGFLPFFKKTSLTAIGVFVDFLTYEFNTFLVTQLNDINELAVYVTWTAIMLPPYFVVLGISATVRTNVGQIMGTGNQNRARRETIAYYFYSFFVLYFMGALLAYFAPNIARLYIDNDKLAPLVTTTVYISAAFAFTAQIIYPTMAVLRLLNLDEYFMKMTVTLFFVLNAIFSGTFCFVCGWGARGIALGHSLSTTIMVFIFMRKVFIEFDWTSIAEFRKGLLDTIEMISQSHRTF